MSMNLLSILFASAFILKSMTYAENITSPADNKILIQQLVESYQTAVKKKSGTPIQLSFRDAQIMQELGGFDAEGELVMIIYHGILTAPTGTALTTTCHELGHILGSVPLSTAIIGRTRTDPRDSVEGEADYFAGGCVRRYHQQLGLSESVSQQAARTCFQNIYGYTPDETLAAEQVYPGINGKYPSPECRLLSTLAGIKGSPRPKCWYNPAPR